MLTYTSICQGPHGPPYDGSYVSQLESITANMKAQPKDVECFYKQGTKTMAKMSKEFDMKGHSMGYIRKVLEKKEPGQLRSNLDAFCEMVQVHSNISGKKVSRRMSFICI